MVLLIDGLFFVSQQNYNHSISGMAAFFAVHARSFLPFSTSHLLVPHLTDRLYLGHFHPQHSHFFCFTLGRDKRRLGLVAAAILIPV
jgi:hypothetical protein